MMKGHARSESASAGRAFRGLSITSSSSSSLSSTPTSTSTSEPKSLHSSVVLPTTQQQHSPTIRSPNYKQANSSTTGGGGVPPLLYGPGALTITRSTTSLPPPQKEAPRGIARATRRNCPPLSLLANKNHQLKANIQRLRAARLPGTDPSHVDASFEEYAGLREECMELARALAGSTTATSSRNVLATSQASGGGNAWYGTSVGDTVERLEKLCIGGSSNKDGRDSAADVDALRASFGGLDISQSSPLVPPSHHPAAADHQGQQRQLRDVIANKAYLATLRDWRDLVTKLVTAHRTSLLETYQAYERTPLSPDTLTRFLRNTHFRAEAIYKMRNATAWTSFKSFNTAPAYWPKYERRCRNFDSLRRDLEEIDRELLGEGRGSGERPGAMVGGEGEEQVSGNRPICGYTIAPRGDTILEFGNDNTVVDDGQEASKKSPVLRFRVSSHMLAETSRYFARLFSHVGDRDWDFEPSNYPQDQQLLPSPRIVVLPSSSSSGSSETLKLYSMPATNTLEPNRHDALSILLHAAHMQTDKVPRTVTFPQFVAIAEVCLQYECTSPLEVFVEHLWLPAWVHMAAMANDQDQDQSGGSGGGGGLLLVSYVFGLRRLFTRMSKTAILHVVDEEDLWTRPWPRKLKERIWAVRNAKLAQVHSACASAVQEYFQPPRRPSSQVTEDSLNNNAAAAWDGSAIFPQQAHTTIKGPSSLLRASTTTAATGRQTMMASPPNNDQSPAPSYASLFLLSSTPRCPKGSHACDAANLGWLLLVFNELHLLQGGSIINPTSPFFPLQHHQQPFTNLPPSRSLAQLLNDLRCIPPSPPVHTSDAGVCDPATALRATVNDIYNSLSGLTLFEVDGKRHGWALSKGKAGEPQSQLTTVPLGVLEIGEGHHHSRTMSAPCIPAATPARTEDADVVMTSTEEDPDMIISEEEESSASLSTPLTALNNTSGHHHQPLSPFPFNEAICLRILSHLDTSDDLYSAALTNRAFYSALKNNELALMRHLVRAHRRLTLHVLDGGLKSPSALGEEHEKTLREAGAVPPSQVADVGEDEDSQNGCPETTAQHTSVDADNLDEPAIQPVDTTPPSTLTNYFPSASHTMTEEEAHRILWPDQPSDYTLSLAVTKYHDTTSRETKLNGATTNENTHNDDLSRLIATTEHDTITSHDDHGASAKFLLDDNVLRLVEDKTLMIVGDKTLREQLDRRIGIGDS